MAYEKIEWEDYPSEKTPIDADNLNHMEEGIFVANEKADSMEESIKKNTEDIIALEEGYQSINEIVARHDTQIDNFYFETIDGVSGYRLGEEGEFNPFRRGGGLGEIWYWEGFVNSSSSSKRGKFQVPTDCRIWYESHRSEYTDGGSNKYHTSISAKKDDEVISLIEGKWTDIPQGTVIECRVYSDSKATKYYSASMFIIVESSCTAYKIVAPNSDGTINPPKEWGED